MNASSSSLPRHFRQSKSNGGIRQCYGASVGSSGGTDVQQDMELDKIGHISPSTPSKPKMHFCPRRRPRSRTLASHRADGLGGTGADSATSVTHGHLLPGSVMLPSRDLPIRPDPAGPDLASARSHPEIGSTWSLVCLGAHFKVSVWTKAAHARVLPRDSPALPAGMIVASPPSHRRYTVGCCGAGVRLQTAVPPILKRAISAMLRCAMPFARDRFSKRDTKRGTQNGAMEKPREAIIMIPR